MWRWGSVALALLVASTFGLYLFSDRIIDQQSGLIICANDCRDYDNLSNYLIERKQFAPGGDFHAMPFYWGYVGFIAALKLSFPGAWPVAYTALSMLVLFAVLAMAARRMAPAGKAPLMLVVLAALAGSHLPLLTYARTLLNDFIFAVVALAVFVSLAAAVEERRWGPLLLAVAVSAAALFIRPNGLFLLLLSLVILVAQTFPVRLRCFATFAGPPAVGVAALVTSAAITAYAVSLADRQVELPTFVAQSLGQFLEFNYFGEDDLTPETRLGLLLTNFPYKSWLMNDGSFWGILTTMFGRVPKLFEISFPEYSRANNLYRLAWYGVVYGLAGLYCLRAWHTRNLRDIVLVVVAASYMLILIATSHVEPRFRLVFDLVFVTMAAHWLTTVVGARGARRASP